MKSKKLIIFCLFQIICVAALAQDNLSIKSVFDEYGKQKGSVYVQLSTDILSQGNSKISLYKSLTLPENAQVEKSVALAIFTDIKKGTKIEEINKNGKLESGTYAIKLNNTTYEYILYKNKSKKITLVYMKGNFHPKELNTELNKLKDLFIYVNNKRIKIN